MELEVRLETRLEFLAKNNCLTDWVYRAGAEGPLVFGGFLPILVALAEETARLTSSTPLIPDPLIPDPSISGGADAGGIRCLGRCCRPGPGATPERDRLGAAGDRPRQPAPGHGRRPHPALGQVDRDPAVGGGPNCRLTAQRLQSILCSNRRSTC